MYFISQMSDMANSDLEKYGKALDKSVCICYWFQCLTLVNFSAIMKYHGLKMEEVNDTMRHLWNKTYQGTGASKFIYNFYSMSNEVFC